MAGGPSPVREIENSPSDGMMLTYLLVGLGGFLLITGMMFGMF